MLCAWKIFTFLLFVTCSCSVLCYVQHSIGSRANIKQGIHLPNRFGKEVVRPLQASLLYPWFLEDELETAHGKKVFSLAKTIGPVFGALVLLNGGNIAPANAIIGNSDPKPMGLTSMRIIKRKVKKRVRKAVKTESKVGSGVTLAPGASRSEGLDTVIKVGGAAVVVGAGGTLYVTAKRKKEKEEKRRMLEEKMKKMTPVKKKKSVPKPKPVTPPEAQAQVSEPESAPVESINELYSSSTPTPKDMAEETPAASSAQPELEPTAEVSAPASVEEAPASTPPPAPVEEKKPAFNLFKKKNTNDRPNSLADALLIQGATEEFRTISAQILAKMAPDSAFPLIKGGETDSQEEAVEKLLASKADAELNDNQAAEEFACVVNAMIVQMVDEAAETLKGHDEESLQALNSVMDFMDSCSSVFESLAENPSIKPVRYNGETGKGKLESLYARYAFDAMGSMGSDNSDKLARLDRLQDVFNIPNGKAEKVAQQAMSKMMQKVMKGEINAADLGLPEGDISEALASLTAEMGGAAGGGGGFPDFGGAMPDFGGEMPPMDPKNMDPKMVQQTIATLKEMVAGGVSPEEVAELRKMFKGMGMDLDELMKMSDQLGANLGPEGRELFDLMKKILKN